MKLIKSKFTLQDLLSRLFIIDSTNKSIKNLLNAVITELKISKLANENIINEVIQKVDLNKSNFKINGDKNENFDDFEIIYNNFDEEKEELKHNKILEEMKKTIFFIDYSETFKNVERKINEIRERILDESNTHLIALLSAKKDLIRLFGELRTEFGHFLSEDKMRKHFPALNEISEINLDENSIGLIIETIICLLSIIVLVLQVQFLLHLFCQYIFSLRTKKEIILKSF